MRLLRKFALVWMFAWLPVSGVMATAMPFCAQGLGSFRGVVMAEESMGTMPCHQPLEQVPGQAQLPVEHCDLCHLGGALVPPSIAVIANTVPGVPPVDAAVSDFRSFISDPPQHPPLFSPA